MIDMDPALEDRLTELLSTRDLHPVERAQIQDAVLVGAQTWDDLPADVQALVIEGESLPRQSWDDPADVPDEILTGEGGDAGRADDGAWADLDDDMVRALSEDPDIRAYVLALAEVGAADPGEDFELLRAAGHDVTPGHDELHHYWTRGQGLSKWVASPHPWTTLYEHLVKFADTPEEAKRWTSRWFIEVFGFAAGSDLNRVTHGRPPRGHRVGPG